VTPREQSFLVVRDLKRSQKLSVSVRGCAACRSRRPGWCDIYLGLEAGRVTIHYQLAKDLGGYRQTTALESATYKRSHGSVKQRLVSGNKTGTMMAIGMRGGVRVCHSYRAIETEGCTMLTRAGERKIGARLVDQGSTRSRGHVRSVVTRTEISRGSQYRRAGRPSTSTFEAQSSGPGGASRGRGKIISLEMRVTVRRERCTVKRFRRHD
jgi:hypothetical protein